VSDFLKLEQFPTTTLKTVDSSITVPCEPVADGLAITAYLDLEYARPHFGGGFTLTHTPSGYMISPGQACLECARESGRLLAELDVDWTAINPANPGTVKASLGDHYAAAMSALRLFTKCTQRMCFHDGTGEEFVCDVCGLRGGEHASHCIHEVLPMVAELNAAAEAARAAR
jgi:hypothetical protein